MLKKNLKRLYRKYGKKALPFLLVYLGINPVRYKTGEKVWKSKPLRKTRTRVKRMVKKYSKVVFVVGLIYYFVQNPGDYYEMFNHLLGNVTHLLQRMTTAINLWG